MGRRKRNPCVQKGATACPDPGHTAPAWRIVSHPPRRRVSAIERCSDRAVVTRWWRSETGSVNNHPRNDERRGLSLDWPATSADEAVSRRRQSLVRRRARGREHHARPSRGCHDDRARNCHGLSPTIGRYADVREAERGMLSRDGGRHYKEERDHCANKGRAQRHEGDLPNNEGDAAGDRADDDRCDRSRTAVIGGKPCGDASELCGVLRYVAHGQQAFLWSTEASFLRHIFWRG